MEFTKEVIYLGMSPNQLSDGGQYFTVNLFLPETNSTIQVNVMDNKQNYDTVSTLAVMNFGDKFTAVFALKPKDKLYRLALVRV